MDWCARTEADGESLAQALDEAAALAQRVYDRAAAINRGQAPGEDAGRLERQLLDLFQRTQDTFVRIDWYGNVQFPQESLQESLELLHGAADAEKSDDEALAGCVCPHGGKSLRGTAETL